MTVISRTPYKISFTEFENIFKLHEKQSWTVGKHEQLFALLQECETIEEQHLVLDLLSAYENFNEERAHNAFSAITKKIIDEWKLDPANTLIVALGNDDEVASGPAFLQQIKPYFAATSWNSSNLISNFKPALKKAKNGINIIFVDDFMGTGGQFSKRFDWFSAELEKNKITLSGIYFAALCIMKQAIPILETRKINHFASHYMDKGITDRFSADKVDEAKKLMVKLEGRLKWNGNHAKFSLGFMQSEALFRYMENNAPNNNFPIFWWKESAEGYRRNTMQQRF